MAWLLSIQITGVSYHVTSLRNTRKRIFPDQTDNEEQLKGFLEGKMKILEGPGLQYLPTKPFSEEFLQRNSGDTSNKLF